MTGTKTDGIGVIDVFDHAECKFVERRPEGTGWTFRPIELGLGPLVNRLRTTMPPRIGDKFALGRHVYKVVDLMWSSTSCGRRRAWVRLYGHTRPV